MIQAEAGAYATLIDLSMRANPIGWTTRATADSIAPMPKLKYEQEIQGLSGCPPMDCIDAPCTAFRFVHKPIVANDGIPPLVQKPSRRIGADDEKCCAGHALSLFVSEEKARAFYARRAAKHKNIKKDLGDHVAALQVQKQDGRQTQRRGDGHFALHEYEKVSITGRLSIVGAL